MGVSKEGREGEEKWVCKGRQKTVRGREELGEWQERGKK